MMTCGIFSLKLNPVYIIYHLFYMTFEMCENINEVKWPDL